MAKQLETITIPKCPICGKSHTYVLQVRRSPSLAMSELNEVSREVTITRLFVCPIEDREFQASFVLHEKQDSSITSVEIGDPKQEIGDERS
jgi:hypothetical protein